jgi:hypothetical protein
MPYVMKRVMLKDKDGQPRRPPSRTVTDEKGRTFEISELPYYIYMPVWEDEPTNEGQDGKPS